MRPADCPKGCTEPMRPVDVRFGEDAGTVTLWCPTHGATSREFPVPPRDLARDGLAAGWQRADLAGIPVRIYSAARMPAAAPKETP